MRPLLILLLAANLLMFAWVQGWLAQAGGALDVPEQVHPERLRVVPLDRLGDPPSPAPPPAPSSAPISTPAKEPLPAPRRSPSREALPMPYAAGPAAALLGS